jgi:hypothetical protein
MDSLSMLAKSAGPKEFIDGGSERRKIYIHTVTMTDLKPGQKYSEIYMMCLCHSLILAFISCSVSCWRPKRME